MKELHMLVKPLVLTALFCLLLPGASCGPEDRHTFFFSDPPHVFRTNDVDRAQEEIPFTLIVPSYLPEGWINTPTMIEGIRKELVDSYDDPVRIQYARTDFDGDILIEEYDYEIKTYPSYEEARYLDINGITVLEQPTGSTVFSSDETEMISGLSYTWNHEGIHIEVRAFYIPTEDSIKIIESMIDSE